MKLKLLGSFSFRLALMQVGIFSVSMAVLLGFLYWIAYIWPIDQVQQSLEREATHLVSVYHGQGTPALIKALDARAEASNERHAFHALIAPDGQVLAYNVPPSSWPVTRGNRWIRLDADVYRNGVERDHEAMTLDLKLSGGQRLLIGRDVEDIDRIERIIRRAAVYVMPPLLLFAIFGAALSSRAIGARIDAMSRAARRVMDGDISERIPLRGGNDDFDQLGETLNAMLDRIEASLEAVRRVSDSVAHELRTPLARLEAALAELRSAPAGRTAELADRAQAEAERLSRIADAVMRISRIEARRHLALTAPVALGDLLEDAVDYHSPEAESRQQTMTADVATGLTVHGDADLIFQAISNLLDNAIKFTPVGGQISLSARRDNGSVLIAITDNGPGIAPEFVEKAGERFFRAPGTASVPGFGLGLALVNAVASVHGSTLKLGDAGPGLRVEWRLAAA
jgi:signal transduction histidine kinase